MTASLSTRADSSWLQSLHPAEQQEMRDVLSAMRSRSGFMIDLRYAGPRCRGTRRLA